MSTAENPMAQGNSADNRLELKLQVEEAPTLNKGKKGSWVNVKTLLTESEIRDLPWVASDDYKTADAAFEAAGSGAHIVNWRTTPGTYAKMAEPNSRHPMPALFDEWTVSVRGVTAYNWENDKGETGISFRFVGLRPMSIPEGCESIKLDELDVRDYSDNEEE